MEKSLSKYLCYIAVALVLVALDQLTKQIAQHNLLGQPLIDVLPILQWGLIFNSGAAFGFLSQAGGLQHYFFVTLASVIAIVLLVWLWRVFATNRLLSCGLVMILAGAVGNLIDRLLYQHVIDFIFLHYREWYFPAFNVADMAITFGAICLIVDSLGLVHENDEGE